LLGNISRTRPVEAITASDMDRGSFKTSSPILGMAVATQAIASRLLETCLTNLCNEAEFEISDFKQGLRKLWNN